MATARFGLTGSLIGLLSVLLLFLFWVLWRSKPVELQLQSLGEIASVSFKKRTDTYYSSLVNGTGKTTLIDKLSPSEVYSKLFSARGSIIPIRVVLDGRTLCAARTGIRFARKGAISGYNEPGESALNLFATPTALSISCFDDKGYAMTLQNVGTDATAQFAITSWRKDSSAQPEVPGSSQSGAVLAQSCQSLLKRPNFGEIAPDNPLALHIGVLYSPASIALRSDTPAADGSLDFAEETFASIGTKLDIRMLPEGVVKGEISPAARILATTSRAFVEALPTQVRWVYGMWTFWALNNIPLDAHDTAAIKLAESVLWANTMARRNGKTPSPEDEKAAEGMLTAINSFRKLYELDAVVYVTEGSGYPGYCGQTPRTHISLQRPDLNYVLVDRVQCGVLTTAVAHEISHLFNARHEAADPKSGNVSYAHASVKKALVAHEGAEREELVGTVAAYLQEKTISAARIARFSGFAEPCHLGQFGDYRHENNAFSVSFTSTKYLFNRWLSNYKETAIFAVLLQAQKMKLAPRAISVALSPALRAFRKEPATRLSSSEIETKAARRSTKDGLPAEIATCDVGLKFCASGKCLHTHGPFFVNFIFGKSILTAHSFEQFPKHELNGHKILAIHGFSDVVGGEDANNQLAMQRAEVFQEILVRNGFAEAKTAQLCSHGHKLLLEGLDTAEKRAMDRRAEIILAQ